MTFKKEFARPVPTDEINIFSGEGSTDQTSYVRLGSLSYDASLDPADTTYSLEYLLETTDAATPIHCDARLYNVTDTVEVSGSVVSSDAQSSTPQLRTRTLVRNTDLKLGSRIYELQVKMSVAGLVSDRVTCTLCALKRIGG